MTVPTTTRKVTYTGNGVQTQFAYPFKIFDEDHLVVVLRDTIAVSDTVLTNPADYTVSGVEVTTGGLVTLTTPPSATEVLIIQRTVPLIQSTNLRNTGSFFPAMIEDRFDLVYMALQQMQDSILEIILATSEGPHIFTSLTLPIASEVWRGIWVVVRDPGTQDRSKICLQRVTDGAYDWQDGPAGGFQ